MNRVDGNAHHLSYLSNMNRSISHLLYFLHNLDYDVKFDMRKVSYPVTYPVTAI